MPPHAAFDLFLLSGLLPHEQVAMIAQHSQRDPKEFLPLLTRLQKLPPLRQKYEIDRHLQRWSRALEHLHELLLERGHEETKDGSQSEADDFFDIVHAHSLHEQAMQLLHKRDNHGLLTRVKLDWAEQLMQAQQWENAVTLYLSTAPPAL